MTHTRTLLTALCLLLLTVACGRPNPGKEQQKNPFTDEVRLPFTPVKDQGSSPLCWAYAMLATIETEHIMRGDSVNLSPDYVARHWLAEQARCRYLSGGQSAVGARGVMPMLLHLIATYGVMPYDAYPSKDADYDRLTSSLDYIASRARSLDALDADVARSLDETLGATPRHVYMLGAEYTPQEFARSVCRADEYVSLTSFTHHPFYTRFALEVADNRLHDTFLNLPLDTLMSVITRALRTGHPVCWEGDTSERGFSFSRGVAKTESETLCTEAERQRAFSLRQTTDDHCMTLIGLARDRHGRRYFLAKNSWGTHNPYGGLMYLSEAYVRAKTIAVIVEASVVTGEP